MSPVRNILLLGSAFSGATDSLRAALTQAGCSVDQVRGSLRGLKMRPLHLAAMTAEAIARRGSSFRQYMFRTRAANRAFGLANAAVVAERNGVDLVMQIGTAFAVHRRPGVLYTLFTDHTNLLSKQLPDFGLDFPQRHVPAVWNEVERENLLQQDHIFVMGTHVKHSMVQDYRIPAERITVVGGGPNLDVDIERDGISKTAGAKNVLFVGLEAQRKGLPALKQAINQVRRLHPTAVLHVVGVDGVDEPGIVHHGPLRGEALKQQFYAAQIFAMPSLREPFGIVFLEAMWSKAVCIGTNLGAMPEIIQHGCLVEPNDVAGLAGCINTLFACPERLQELAEQAYAVARERWSWTVAAGRILAEANRLRAGARMPDDSVTRVT